MSMIANKGFKQAPVCKFLLGSAIGSSLLLQLPLKQFQGYFIYTHTSLFDKGQVWRILTSKLAFLDLKDLFVCSLLIYYFRVFEKRFGSRKFSSYLLGSALVSTILEVLAVYACRTLEIPIGPLPTGPLCLIYPMFVPFYCDIPRVPLSHIWGVPMTGKSISYILGLQAASSSPGSMVVAICGLLGGILWRCNLCKIQSLVKIPGFIGRFCQATFGRLLGEGENTHMDTTQIGATIEIQRQEMTERLEQQVIWQSVQQQLQQTPRAAAQNLVNGPGIFGAINNNRDGGVRYRNLEENVQGQEPAVVSEDQVRQLVEMGFLDNQVRNALRVANNDIAVATNILLQNS
ncbi:ubiquitin-associated domain-containing protein 2-like [Mya arenaria]|uniref:ubiquitin-associated domain-containing protein 2-like n=1 Tax=Mya arenaria TaxID=6604 RepID=UPI0022DF266F|nr:ubiquitin-associated domain-containing protein 2-like [Mya arenaria]